MSVKARLVIGLGHKAEGTQDGGGLRTLVKGWPYLKPESLHATGEILNFSTPFLKSEVSALF